MKRLWPFGFILLLLLVMGQTMGPPPSLTAVTCSAHQFANALGVTSSTCAQPAVGDISGFGTGVATALGINVGSAGAPVTNGGALGTPSSGTLTNATGLPLPAGAVGTAFTSWTPTITASTGTFTTTSCSCKYQQTGRWVLAYGTITITTIGSASGRAIVTLPVNNLAGQSWPFAASLSTFVALLGIVNFDASNAASISIAGAGNGSVIYFTALYEAASG